MAHRVQRVLQELFLLDILCPEVLEELAPMEPLVAVAVVVAVELDDREMEPMIPVVAVAAEAVAVKAVREEAVALEAVDHSRSFYGTMVLEE